MREPATALALFADYRRGVLSPVDEITATFERLARLDKMLNAFVAIRPEGALADARASADRHARQAPLSALDGVPVAVKDNIPVQGMPCTWGSRSGSDHLPVRDELAVARLRAAGAIVVGKTNVPEFTLEGYTSNALFGTSRNPWNTALTPGGSSGGSVAAVAAGIVPLALGTDGGGSIRRPASHTGLVGFKPSIGKVPRVDGLPPLLLDMEVLGPIARSVVDARILLDALAGPAATDRRSLAASAAPARPFPARVRIRYVPRFGDAPVDPEIAASCARAMNRLASLGHDVVEAPLGLDVERIAHHWPAIGRIGLAWLFEHHPRWAAEASTSFRQMAAEGAASAAPLLWEVTECIEALRRACVPLFETTDLVVTPSAAALPWTAEQTHPPMIDGRQVGPRGHAVFTAWVNAAGLPALALPCEPSSEGLPIGLQFVAGFGRDTELLSFGERIESAICPRWRWPLPLERD